jgi:flagellar biosynthesis chaperone FliJ
MSDQTSQDARAVLVDKAQRHAQQCAEVLAQHQQRLARLLSSADRVTTMLGGYQHRLAEAQRRSRPMADTRNERLFLHNLRVMADKLSTDVQSARALRDAAARTLGEAERSVLQARKLLEIAQQARRAEQARRDQAELDGWSTMRHAWSAHTPTPSER